MGAHGRIVRSVVVVLGLVAPVGAAAQAPASGTAPAVVPAPAPVTRLTRDEAVALALRENTIGVGISIPLRIFDRNQGEIARTRAEIDRVDALREVARAQVLADVDTAVSTLTIQGDRVGLLRGTYLPKAQQARDTVEFAYRRGGVSLLDFLDAQRTYRETALEQLRALGNYWGAVYQLEAAVGGETER